MTSETLHYETLGNSWKCGSDRGGFLLWVTNICDHIGGGIEAIALRCGHAVSDSHGVSHFDNGSIEVDSIYAVIRNKGWLSLDCVRRDKSGFVYRTVRQSAAFFENFQIGVSTRQGVVAT